MSIEEKVSELEKRLEHVSAVANLPRKPGDISAAVRQAQASVADAETRVQNKADAAVARLSQEIANLRQEIRDASKQVQADLKLMRDEIREYEKGVNDTIKATVDNHTVQVLMDYGVLNENASPSSKYFSHEILALVREELAKK
jgi:phage host-nuclease inhibitor protein Gam